MKLFTFKCIRIDCRVKQCNDHAEWMQEGNRVLIADDDADVDDHGGGSGDGDEKKGSKKRNEETHCECNCTTDYISTIEWICIHQFPMSDDVGTHSHSRHTVMV